MTRRVLLSWSSGKDCAWALHRLRQQPDLEVVGLLTTFNQAANRVSMHAVRRTLVEAQARATGLPLWPVDLPWPCSNTEYAERMAAVLTRARAESIEAIAFGDLFLEDVRDYRIAQMAGTGITPLFPLWTTAEGTGALARAMQLAGVRAVITCVDPKQLPAHFAGREWGPALLDELPGPVDPCGERGEFHTYCFAGPMFETPLGVSVGETVERDGFVFADVTDRNAEDPGRPRST